MKEQDMQNEKHGKLSKHRPFSNFKESGVALAFLTLCVILSFASPYFLTILNIFNVLRQISVIAILAVGMSMVIVSQGIDLSIGWILGLCGVCAAVFTNLQIPAPFVLILTILAGMFCGLLNGMLITRLNIAPFIVTLGTGYIFRGLTLFITNAKPIPFDSPLALMGSGYLGVVPVSVILMVVISILGHIFSQKTVLGRNIYALGDNEKAAMLSGIKVENCRVIVYMLVGFVASISGIIISGNISYSDPMSGSGFEMDAIAACFIGGISTRGGTGTVLGAIIGAALMGTLRNGFVLLKVSSFLQIITIGVVIIVAVFIDVTRRGKMR